MHDHSKLALSEVSGLTTCRKTCWLIREFTHLVLLNFHRRPINHEKKEETAFVGAIWCSLLHQEAACRILLCQDS
ncbi:hypothetical protein O181_046072, partial [Austropuccinia psidii MF-1]|nr:hypothetical protein [Austropuccinia psidii MF-1]